MSGKSSLAILVLLVILLIPQVNFGSMPSTSLSEESTDLASLASYSVIWHDDCSNTSSFPDLADAWYNGAMGSIASQDGYIYATDYGTASGSHGPVYYHTFSPSLNISQFESLEAEIELDGSSASGAAALMLYDSDNKRVAILDVADSWVAVDNTVAYAAWYNVNFAGTYTPKDYGDTIAEPYHETLRLILNSTGLYGSIPRIGNFKMLDKEELELDRDITYLCVQFRQGNSYTPCQTMRIHDIKMQYLVEASPSTTDPSTTSPNTSPTSSTNPGSPDIALVISLGSMGVIVIAIGIICTRGKPGAPQDTGSGYNW
jgi:hypothetical protein